MKDVSFIRRDVLNFLFAGDDCLTRAGLSASATFDTCVRIDVIDVTF